MYVAVDDFLLDNTCQAVLDVVVGVGGEVTQKACEVIVYLGVSRLPAERHDDLCVDDGGVADDAALLVRSLIEWHGVGSYLRSDELLEA